MSDLACEWRSVVLGIENGGNIIKLWFRIYKKIDRLFVLGVAYEGMLVKNAVYVDIENTKFK